MRGKGSRLSTLPPGRRLARSGTVLCCVLAALSCLCLTGSALAAGVVTDDDRTWAREALREERDLQVDASRNTVGVLYFENNSGDAALDPFQKGLSLMLVTDLSSVAGLEVVERVRLQALVEELGLGRSGLVEAGTAHGWAVCSGLAGWSAERSPRRPRRPYGSTRLCSRCRRTNFWHFPPWTRSCRSSSRWRNSWCSRSWSGCRSA